MTTLLLTSGIAPNSALLHGLLFYIRNQHRILYHHFRNMGAGAVEGAKPSHADDGRRTPTEGWRMHLLS